MDFPLVPDYKGFKLTSKFEPSVTTSTIAKDMLEKRLQIGSDNDINSTISQPKYKIAVVDLSELSSIKQTDKQVINYVIENGKKIDDCL